MNLLLDTHAFIWWLDDDRRLSKRARKSIADAGTTVFVSAATGYEMAMKSRIGKLADPDGAIPRLTAVLAERGMMELPVVMSHAVEAGRIAGHHRDPFDRILIAQSRIEGLPVVTNDPVFADHGIRVIW